MQAPIPNSYWLKPRRFAAGEYPGARTTEEAENKLRMLLTAGLDHFIDLTEENEGLAPYAQMLAHLGEDLGIPASHQRIAIRDAGVPRTAARMSKTLDAIDSALAAGSNVYLHCWGGVGRTGTTVGCWLVRHGMTGEQALAHIAGLWRGVAKAHRLPHSPETREQAHYVRAWHERTQPV